MNITDDIRDQDFKNGMLKSAFDLGDNGVGDRDNFQPDWDSIFLQELHGVALIAGDSHESVDSALAEVKGILGASVREVGTLQGDVRPGPQRGHEQ